MLIDASYCVNRCFIWESFCQSYFHGSTLLKKLYIIFVLWSSRLLRVIRYMWYKGFLARSTCPSDRVHLTSTSFHWSVINFRFLMVGVGRSTIFDVWSGFKVYLLFKQVSSDLVRICIVHWSKDTAS